MAEYYKGLSKKALKKIIDNTMQTATEAGRALNKLVKENILLKQKNFELENKPLGSKSLTKTNATLCFKLSELEVTHKRIVEDKIESYHALEKNYNRVSEEKTKWEGRYKELNNKFNEITGG